MFYVQELLYAISCYIMPYMLYHATHAISCFMFMFYVYVGLHMPQDKNIVFCKEHARLSVCS